jgi:hypothetical protein
MLLKLKHRLAAFCKGHEELRHSMFAGTFEACPRPARILILTAAEVPAYKLIDLECAVP